MVLLIIVYLRKMILNNYKKSFEDANKIIDNKNIQKFVKVLNKSKTNNKKILVDIDIYNFIYKYYL